MSLPASPPFPSTLLKRLTRQYMQAQRNGPIPEKIEDALEISAVQHREKLLCKR